MAQIEPVLDAKGAADQVEDVDQAPVPLLVRAGYAEIVREEEVGADESELGQHHVRLGYLSSLGIAASIGCRPVHHQDGGQGSRQRVLVLKPGK